MRDTAEPVGETDATWSSLTEFTVFRDRGADSQDHAVPELGGVDPERGACSLPRDVRDGSKRGHTSWTWEDE